MTNEQAISVIIGFLTPFVVSWLKKEEWNFEKKVAVTWLVSFLFAVVSTYFSNQLELTLDKLIVNLAIIIGVSQSFYSMLYEKIFEKMRKNE